MRKPLFTVICGVALMVGAGIGSLAVTPGYGTPYSDDSLRDVTAPAGPDLSESIDYIDHVTVYKNGEPVASGENALMEGEAIIRNQSTGTDQHQWTTISVGNGSTPTDTSTSLSNEVTEAGTGMTPQSADIEFIGSGADDVEWNLTASWTAQKTIRVNTSAVKSTTAPADIDYYAGFAFGRNVNLVSGDNLTVEWNFDPD